MSLNEAKMSSLADKLNASQPEETVVAPQTEEVAQDEDVDQKKASKKKASKKKASKKKASKKKKDKIDK